MPSYAFAIGNVRMYLRIEPKTRTNRRFSKTHPDARAKAVSRETRTCGNPKCIAVHNAATPLLELTCHMGCNVMQCKSIFLTWLKQPKLLRSPRKAINVTCHPAEVTVPRPPLPQQGCMVLHLATAEGCKAKLT